MIATKQPGRTLAEIEADAVRSAKLSGRKLPDETKAKMHASALHERDTAEWEQAVEYFLHCIELRETVADGIQRGRFNPTDLDPEEDWVKPYTETKRFIVRDRLAKAIRRGTLDEHLPDMIQTFNLS